MTPRYPPEASDESFVKTSSVAVVRRRAATLLDNAA
jgi:hypothetical protein